MSTTLADMAPDAGTPQEAWHPHRSARERARLTILRVLGAMSVSSIRRSRAPLPDPCSVLVIRPDHLGDLLFLMPALRRLREAMPDARVSLLVGPWGRELIERHPCVDEVMTCAFPAFTREPKTSLVAPYQYLLQEARRLREWHFDLALIMRFDHWWGALLARAAGVPRRMGYALPEVRPFLTHPVPYAMGKHEVQQNLTLVSSIGQLPPETHEVSETRDTPRLEFEPSAGEQRWAQRWLTSQGLAEGKPLIAIQPGAGATVKLWTAGRWAALADALAERHSAQIVLTGSANELDLAWSVAARMGSNALIAVGQTSLGQLAAIYRRCQLIVGLDSGPLHLAVAVDTPTLHLYGPVDSGTFGPWGDPFRHRVLTSDWPCIPCNRLDIPPSELLAHRCVRDITVTQVFSEAEALLAGRW